MSKTFSAPVYRIQKGLANRGKVKIDAEVMDKHGISPGEFVQVEGNHGSKLAAKAIPRRTKEEHKGGIFMSGLERQALGVKLQEDVEVTVLEDVPKIDSITFSTPPDKRIAIQSDRKEQQEELLRNSLQGRAFVEGQWIQMSNVRQQRFNLVATEVEPNGGPGVITPNTELHLDLSQPEAGGRGGQRRGASHGHGQQQEGTVSRGAESVPDVSYEDIGGLDNELEKVREMIELPMRHPELFTQVGIEAPKGVVLHGPPGTGKTLIARAVANEVDASFQTISGPEIVSKFYGQSEEELRNIFEEAEENSPSVIFIDELDSIAPTRDEAQGDVDKRIVAQLLSLMDGLESRGEVVVIAATNRLDAVDPALRRGGRFDREIEIGVPDRDGRKEIFQIHTRDMPLSEEVEVDSYADRTHGFVGADIAALTKESGMNAIRRVKPEIAEEIQNEESIPMQFLEEIEITDEDFEDAMKTVEPSAMREVFVEVPDISYEEVGGLEDAKEHVQEAVEWPLNHETAFEHFGTDAPSGVLLYGPPGTGKTLLAKAVANASDSNFISVKGPELLNKYVGESEKGVREIFKKARQNAPTVIFFDELDALAMERGSETGSNVSERVVSQMLTELDGLEELKDVKVIAATNRPDMIDKALLRPGRLDKLVSVPLPNEEAREEIFNIHTKDMPLADNIDMKTLASKTNQYSGSDIEAVCREASMIAMRRYVKEDGENLEDREVQLEDFEEALDQIVPSLTEEDIEEYKQIQKQVGGAQDLMEPDSSRSVGFQ